MLARSSELKLKGCRALKTPLFVPSFSSRGFELGDGYSEVKELYKFASSRLGDISLISAYDIHHHHLDWSDIQESHSEVLFVDSGGYEAADRDTKGWTFDELQKTLRDRPEEIPTLLVSYDSPVLKETNEQQIQRAFTLQDKFSSSDIDLLIRSEDKSQSINIFALEKHLEAFKSFAVLGVTEKDLGSSTQERMIAIYSLRRLLDGANIAAPIHVFGSLSPVTSILYFLMGAEIFDGLSWLRHHFVGHQLFHMTETYSHVEEISADLSDLRKARILLNLDYLEALSTRARQFCVSKDWSLLPAGSFCKQVIESIEGRV